MFLVIVHGLAAFLQFLTMAMMMMGGGGTALEFWCVLFCVGFANVAARKLNVALNCMKRSTVSASSFQMPRDEEEKR